MYCELRTKGKILNEFYDKKTKTYSFKNFIKNSKGYMDKARRCDKDTLTFETDSFPKDVFEELCKRHPNASISLDFYTSGRGRRVLLYENGETIYKDEGDLARELKEFIKNLDINRLNIKDLPDPIIVSYPSDEKHNYEEESENEEEEL